MLNTDKLKNKQISLIHKNLKNKMLEFKQILPIYKNL